MSTSENIKAVDNIKFDTSLLLSTLSWKESSHAPRKDL